MPILYCRLLRSENPRLGGAGTRHLVAVYPNTCVRNVSGGANGLDYLR